MENQSFSSETVTQPELDLIVSLENLKRDCTPPAAAVLGRILELWKAGKKAEAIRVCRDNGELFDRQPEIRELLIQGLFDGNRRQSPWALMNRGPLN